MVSPDLYLELLQSSAMNTSDITQEDSDTPEQVNTEEIKIEFYSDYFYSPNI
jgi:hypothetical protein